ncbi:hypothetical protein DK847_10455 [Aestuariivirga litoralis]|uniref:HTH tetR-type domain-containing protein n=1 Tax=Aestuariivirga litoralis TaxID=2650924 RepID=A0A2W2B9Y9_9HYPH|nr:TetR/AcrR family transcriptional regulator [Aestuariivirga litoralis]PZF76878.1 hypothetical protein DK847_10455 [Aestuariivirga litoralis]
MRSRTTRKRLIDAAYRIISEESLSQLSIDHVSKVAGLSRRTFFLHFASKDQLLAEVLENLRPAYAETYRQWSEGLPAELGAVDRITELFRRIVERIGQPGWKGCAFVRISAEFAEWQGHPAHGPVAEAQRDFELWLADELRRARHASPARAARQLAILINGLIISQMVHRDAAYGEAALAALPLILGQ